MGSITSSKNNLDRNYPFFFFGENEIWLLVTLLKCFFLNAGIFNCSLWWSEIMEGIKVPLQKPTDSHYKKLGQLEENDKKLFDKYASKNKLFLLSQKKLSNIFFYFWSCLTVFLLTINNLINLWVFLKTNLGSMTSSKKNSDQN